MLFFGSQAKAGLVDIGNGLIYDSTDNVTWISNGLYFSNDIVANGTGALVGTVVNPQYGPAYTVTAADFSYNTTLAREVATWYGATAYANNLSYQYGSQTITGWSLPTVAELTGLYNQVGNYGSVAPFVWIPGKIWTSNEADANNAYYVNYQSSIPGVSVYSQAVLKSGDSNVWAVVPGDVAAVPEPEEYGMLLLGFGLVGYQIKRKQRKSAQLMA